MPLRLEIRKQLSSRSDRVKSVDLHPIEPWVLTALYTGNVFIWDIEQATMVKSYEICTLPVRCAKFIIKKQWFIAASDDMFLRVFSYNTMEKINAWEAHTDYIRFIEVHPTLPCVLSCSDDMSIKMWDWEKNWDCIQVYDGHAHYVMMIKINPKDSNSFASASLDRSIKVWGITSNSPHYTLEGHDRGVNCLDYYPGGDRPYLVSGADDKTIKIWDYQTKTCVHTLTGHHNNVSAVMFHSRLPIIVSASEDGTVRLWHSTTYRAETTLNYSMERAWTIAVSHHSNKIAVGYDEGAIVIQLGNDLPIASLDPNTGRIVWTQNNDVLTASLKGLVAESGVQDGERIPLVPKDLGSTEIFPQSIKHNCNGRFLVVCGDGEYVIYTSQALRNKSFGSALDFAWSAVGTGDYAVRESISRVRTFKNFKEAHTLRPPLGASEGLFGGACLGVRGSDAIVFFDWDEGVMVRKIDVSPKEVYWNETGELVLLACEESYFVLRYDAAAVSSAYQKGEIDGDEGIEAAFELVSEIAGKVRTGLWVGACFLYTSDQDKLSYYVGGEVMTLCHLDHQMFMLGYLPKEDRVYLMDKMRGVYSYKVLQSYLQYQTAVVQNDFETANALLPSIPSSEYTAVARFLESQGYKEEALTVSRDPDHRFDLACDLGDLSLCKQLLESMPQEEYGTLDAQTKWKRLGDLALQQSDLDLVEKCANNSEDLSGLLLLYSSTGNVNGMINLASAAINCGKTNIAFITLFLLGKVEDCLQLLEKSGRIPEAAFMARTYMPSEVPRLLSLWKNDLKKISEKAADALADPTEDQSLFPDLKIALQVEAVFKAKRGNYFPASTWSQAKDDLDLNLIEIFKSQPILTETAETVAIPDPERRIADKIKNIPPKNEKIINEAESDKVERKSDIFDDAVLVEQEYLADNLSPQVEIINPITRMEPKISSKADENVSSTSRIPPEMHQTVHSSETSLDTTTSPSKQSKIDVVEDSRTRQRELLKQKVAETRRAAELAATAKLRGETASLESKVPPVVKAAPHVAPPQPMSNVSVGEKAEVSPLNSDEENYDDEW